jgi:hypothetical protein
LCFLLGPFLWNRYFLQWSQKPWNYMCYHIWNLLLLHLLVLISRCLEVASLHLIWWWIIWMRIRHLGMLLLDYLKCMKQVMVPWHCNSNLCWKNLDNSLNDCFCERWGWHFGNHGYNTTTDIIDCEPLKLLWVYKGTCFGHVMSKTCQSATSDDNVSMGLTLVNVKDAQIGL